jgi:hypothetical protein
VRQCTAKQPIATLCAGVAPIARALYKLPRALQGHKRTTCGQARWPPIQHVAADGTNLSYGNMIPWPSVCCKPVAAAGVAGQPKSVHVASDNWPLAGHIQVFTPSPTGYSTNGEQRPVCSEPPLPVGHWRRVHMASRLRPLAGQTQVLQPSSADKIAPGQHWSSPLGLWGRVQHLKWVQRASCLEPLSGHMQELRPSPAGKGRKGKHRPSGSGRSEQVILVHLASLLLPLAGQVHVLHPSGAVHVKCGQHWSSGCEWFGSGCRGDAEHCKLVQLASRLRPLRGHMHVFRPSPAGKEMLGWHLPTGNRSSGGAWHTMLVHTASLFLPLVGQVQVLHPSVAVKSVCGQHCSSSIGSCTGLLGVCPCGGVWHFMLVQSASLFKPLKGHVQVLRPSPAGYAMPGMHRPSDSNGIGHVILVHLASLLLPEAGQVHVLHPSGAIHDKLGQHWSSGLSGSSGCGSSGMGSSGAGLCPAGRTEHLKLEQAESLLKPLHGHMHVFKPSPAGYRTPGVQLPSGTTSPG